MLLGNDVLIIENLANLRAVVDSGCGSMEFGFTSSEPMGRRLASSSMSSATMLRSVRRGITMLSKGAHR